MAGKGAEARFALLCQCSLPTSSLRVLRWGGAFTTGPGSAARPPQNHGPGPRGLRAHAVSTHPELVRPPHPSALAAGVPVGATHDPRRRRARHPSCLRHVT
jgi:hypothetical protein